MENAHFSIPAFFVALIAYVTVRLDKVNCTRIRHWRSGSGILTCCEYERKCVRPWWIIATAVHSCAGRTESWSVHDAVFSDK